MMMKLINAPKNEISVEFSVIENSNGPCTKKIGLDDQDNLIKDSTPCRIAEGVLKVVSIPFSNFPEFMHNLEKNEAIIHGIPINGKKRLKILSKKKFDGQPGTITREKSNFGYPKDCYSIMMFDYDHDDNTEYLSPDSFIAIISNIIPGFSECAKIISYSTSSFIHDEDGKSVSSEHPVYHLYVAVKHGEDIERFGRVLIQRLCLAGHGFAFITRNGKIFIRTIIDAAVFSRERLDFTSGAICKNGLVQNRPKPEYIPGSALNTKLLTDLTEKENKKYLEIVEQLKSDAGPTAESKKKKYQKNETEKIIKTGVPANRAESIVKQRQAGNLIPGDKLIFDKYGPVDVADVWMDPDKYDQETLADPGEPDYGGGKGKAKLYWNKDTGQLIIHSFAHGGQIYHLKSNWDFETVKQMLLRKCGNGDLPNPYWTRLLCIADLGPVSEGKVLELLVNLNVGKKRELQQELNSCRQKFQNQKRKELIRRQQKKQIEYSPLNISGAAEKIDSILSQCNCAWGYFKHAGRLVYVVTEKSGIMHSIDGKNIASPKTTMIKSHNADTLRPLIEKSLVLIKKNKHGDYVEIPVPDKVLSALLKYPNSKAVRIEGVAAHPLIDYSGKVIQDEGVNNDYEIYINFGGNRFCIPNKKYSQEDAKLAAKRILYNLFNEFEWADSESGPVVALSVLLTAILRKILPSAPGVLIVASTPGTGKTTLARLIYITVTGCDMPVATLEGNSQEVKKELFSMLLEAPEIICFDNIPDGTEINDSNLAKILTTAVFNGRLLGGNEIGQAPTNSLILMTGNNLSLGSDLNRRCVRISLRSKTEEPQKKRFKHFDIRTHCLNNRAQNIQDALIIIKAYFDAGRQLDDKNLDVSGFTEWDRMVRYPVLWATGIDPVKSIDSNKIYSREVTAMTSVAHSLNRLFPNAKFRAADVYHKLDSFSQAVELTDDEKALLEGMSVLNISTTLSPNIVGKILNKMDDRFLDGLKLGVKRDAKRGNKYFIESWPVTDRHNSAA